MRSRAVTYPDSAPLAPEPRLTPQRAGHDEHQERHEQEEEQGLTMTAVARSPLLVL